jgi:hypothetical protein
MFPKVRDPVTAAQTLVTKEPVAKPPLILQRLRYEWIRLGRLVRMRRPDQDRGTVRAADQDHVVGFATKTAPVLFGLMTELGFKLPLGSMSFSRIT